MWMAVFSPDTAQHRDRTEPVAVRPGGVPFAGGGDVNDITTGKPNAARPDCYRTATRLHSTEANLRLI
jgi:hypothetical protein